MSLSPEEIIVEKEDELVDDETKGNNNKINIFNSKNILILFYLNRKIA